MKVAVSADGCGLNAPFSALFGRCKVFVFVDLEGGSVESVPNDGVAASGGAGIQAAQLVADRGAAVTITGNVGPNAFQVLERAGVCVHQFSGATVGEAVESFKLGRLTSVAEPTAAPHSGMGSRG